VLADEALRGSPRLATTPALSRSSAWNWSALLTSGLGLFTVAFMVWAVRGGGDPIRRALLSDLAFVGVGLAVVFLAALTARAEPDPRNRRAWRVLTAAYALYCAGDALWLYYETRTYRPPVSALPSVPYLLYYPVLLAGLLSFSRAFRSRGDALRFWLDACTVVVGGGMVVWHFVLGPISLQAESGEDVALLVAYPLGDLVLLLSIAVLVLRRPDDRRRPALLLLAGGLTVNFVADVIFGMQNLAGAYEGGLGTDALFLFAWFCLGASAHLYRRATPRAATEATAAAPVRSIHLLPYASVAVGYAMLLWAVFERPQGTMGGLVLGAVALTALVIVRQVVAVRENARLLAEHTARQGEARFRSLVQNSSDIITVVDARGRIGYQTPSVERMLGYAPAELLGTPLSALIHADDVPRAQALLADCAAHAGAKASAEWRLQRRDGSSFFVEATAVNLLADPNLDGVVVTIRDVQERKLLEDRLTHEAFHDPLTSLANRALLTNRVEHALARVRRDARPPAVLFLDLDNFKTVNDSLGHAVGDQVLAEFARRLQSCVRATDTPARLGGDEFAVLLEDTTGLDAAREIAERVARSLREPFGLHAQEVFLTVSIGIALAGRDTAAELLRNADVAMYAAKQQGKDRVVVFEPSMHAALVARLELEADLRRAVERREFVLHYQPIVDVAHGRIAGAEALIRWRHPQRGLLYPGQFIEMAETSDLIVPIGGWALEEACRQARAWQSGGEPVHVSVNLSARQLQEPGLVGRVAAALQASGLPPSRLVLEITESLVMLETRTIVARLHDLKRLGVQLAIDDFGTGYSSLSYLQKLPVDILKIDKSFMDELTASPGAALVLGIVELGKAMGMATVAEGIEAAEQVAALRSFGAHYAQGYYFARPVEPAVLEALLASGPLPAPAA
jgi:diguanylate cyclase (GGDEF)-like protein/PAS domain S-box-containing protein